MVVRFTQVRVFGNFSRNIFDNVCTFCQAGQIYRYRKLNFSDEKLFYKREKIKGREREKREK